METVEHPVSDQEDPALRYVVAVQEGHCERVLEMTRWMRERIGYVKATDGSPGVVEDTRDNLCADLQDRPVEANVLTEEGIDDKFAFPPGALVEVVRRDEGRRDLGEPIDHRTWVRVTYPVERYAPRDTAGRAIRSMVVGISVSAQGLIVKAGVLGNLEVDRTSIQVESPGSPGE